MRFIKIHFSLLHLTLPDISSECKWGPVHICSRGMRTTIAGGGNTLDPGRYGSSQILIICLPELPLEIFSKKCPVASLPSDCMYLKFNPVLGLPFLTSSNHDLIISPLDPEEEMAAHSTIIALEIQRTEEPGGLQSMGLQRVTYD